MATALQGFRCVARSCVCTQAPSRFTTSSNGARRAFSAAAPLQAKKSRRIAAAYEKAKGSKTPAAQDFQKTEAELDGLEVAETEVDGVALEDSKQNFRNFFGPPPVMPTRRLKLKETFMNMGETEPWEEETTMEDDDDDIPSLGHGELEQHREMRHYARLVTWEMPLLTKLAKPFQPPTKEMPLRFRYTTYMGEQHPAEKKVVLEFSPADMPGLTEAQTDKLRKLVGVRYNPEKDVVKMSCEMFETQAQNKRYLGDIVGSLLKEAKDPTDTFKDIPLDTRHHHFKPKPKFPKEWEMTDDRQVQLANYRQAMTTKDQELEMQGQLVDGVRQIEEGLRKALAAKLASPDAEMVMAGRGAKGKGKKVAVRR